MGLARPGDGNSIQAAYITAPSQNLQEQEGAIGSWDAMESRRLNRRLHCQRKPAPPETSAPCLWGTDSASHRGLRSRLSASLYAGLRSAQ